MRHHTSSYVITKEEEERLSEQKEFLLNGLPVVVLTENEFAKKEGVTFTIHKDNARHNQTQTHRSTI
jgi:hypothetical protein